MSQMDNRPKGGKGVSFCRNCGAASVGEWNTKIWFINGVDNVNWPPYRDWKADISSVSPSSKQIGTGPNKWNCKPCPNKCNRQIDQHESNCQISTNDSNSQNGVNGSKCQTGPNRLNGWIAPNEWSWWMRPNDYNCSPGPTRPADKLVNLGQDDKSLQIIWTFKMCKISTNNKLVQMSQIDNRPKGGKFTNRSKQVNCKPCSNASNRQIA